MIGRDATVELIDWMRQSLQRCTAHTKCVVKVPWSCFIEVSSHLRLLYRRPINNTWQNTHVHMPSYMDVFVNTSDQRSGLGKLDTQKKTNNNKKDELSNVT